MNSKRPMCLSPQNALPETPAKLIIGQVVREMSVFSVPIQVSVSIQSMRTHPCVNISLSLYYGRAHVNKFKQDEELHRHTQYDAGSLSLNFNKKTSMIII